MMRGGEVGLTAVGQSRAAVGAERVEHAEADQALAGAHMREHRRIDQGAQVVEDRPIGRRYPSPDGLRRSKVEGTDEDRQPIEEDLLLGREVLVAPVEGGRKAGVACWGWRSVHEESEWFPQPVGYLGGGQDRHPSCGHLDRQGQALEGSTDPGNVLERVPAGLEGGISG